MRRFSSCLTLCLCPIIFVGSCGSGKIKTQAKSLLAAEAFSPPLHFFAFLITASLSPSQVSTIVFSLPAQKVLFGDEKIMPILDGGKFSIPHCFPERRLTYADDLSCFLNRVKRHRFFNPQRHRKSPTTSIAQGLVKNPTRLPIFCRQFSRFCVALCLYRLPLISFNAKL